MIKIMLWNANGLYKRKNELQLLLETDNIDICLISETHFTKQSYFNIENYETYHTIHPMNCARGGSAVIIRKSLKHFESNKISSHEFQATSVTIETNTAPINVMALYSPPRHSIKKEQYNELFQLAGERFIIGGDFNAKHTHWGSRLITPKGRELFKAAQTNGCDFISTGKPTYWPTDTGKTPDLIDFFVSRKISTHFLKVEEGYGLNSDHSPIYLTLSSNIIEKENTPTLTNKRTNWNYFKYILSSNITRTVPQNIDELENEVLLFTQAIQSACWQSTPIVKPKIPGKNYPQEIKLMVKLKRKLRKRWQRSRDPEVKAQLNKITKEINSATKDIKNQALNKYLIDLSNDKSTEYSLWKATKSIKRPIMTSPPIKTPANEWAKSNIQKANLFSEHLENTFSPIENENSFVLTDIYLVPDEEIPLATTQEIKSLIKKELTLKKAPGFDLITTEVLQQLPHNAFITLSNIINACIRLKYVPSYWKIAEVIMILKEGKDPNNVTSYRPISLLPMLSKILEKIFKKRLNLIVEARKLIPSHQFGFRECHSTIDQVHRITNIIEKAYEDSSTCSAVFLDVSQAFDKVWHPGLIFKLKQQLPKSYCDFLESYLYERRFRVKQDDSYSNLREIKAGVPQGSILGPLLYLLFTSDLPHIGDHHTATFADDTALLAIGKTAEESTEILQKALNSIVEWTKKWRIKLNNEKSVHVDFSYRKIVQKKIYIDGIEIPYSNSAKYLGMNLDAKLKWKEHIKKKRLQLDIKFAKMYWLLGRKSVLSVHNKLLIYKQVLKPVWTYGIQLWGCSSESNIAVIQRFQNKVLRTIVNAPWFVRSNDLHRDLHIKSVSNVIKEYSTAHAQRLEGHVNEEASRLNLPANYKRRLQRLRPSDLVLLQQ